MRDEPRNQKSRVNRAWNGVITGRDRRYAATDPRQLDLPFPSEADSFPPVLLPARRDRALSGSLQTGTR